jgi:N utilization substance protein A
VKEDQLSLGIGRRGQNVRLASKLVGWDIEIMTMDELNEGISRAEGWFSQIPNVPPEAVERFIEEGFLSFDDLTFVEPAEMAELIGVTEEEADDMIQYAEEMAEQIEQEKANAPPEEGAGRGLVPRHGPTNAAAALFGDTTPDPTEARPTLDSLFGPADAAPADQGEVTPQPTAAVEPNTHAHAHEAPAEAPQPHTEEAHGN